jgi:hypothetical protein
MLKPMNGNLPEIYIHVGLGRTGSTFLQQRVFPKFRKIHYFRHTHFRGAIRPGETRTIGEIDGPTIGK